MTRLPLMLLVAGAAALSACNKSSHTIIAGGDDDNIGNNAVVPPAELPPTVASSKVYRCADNSVIYIDWLSDKKSANLRTSQTATPTHLTADTAGKPMSGSGYTLEGAFAASTVSVTQPGEAKQSCDA